MNQADYHGDGSPPEWDTPPEFMNPDPHAWLQGGEYIAIEPIFLEDGSTNLQQAAL